MLQTNAANPYNDQQMNSARQGAGNHSNSSQSLPSISLTTSTQNENNSKSNRRGSDQEEIKDDNMKSIEIVNISLENTSKLPKVASEEGKSMHINLQDGAYDQLQNNNIVIEQDKLLEPSIDFQPEQLVQKSIRKTNINRKKRTNNNETPDFLIQGQEIACKCNICLQQVRILKSDGLDPQIMDLIQQKVRQDKFLNKQPACDMRMQEMQLRDREHLKQTSAQKNRGDENFQKDILREMERIKDTGKMTFKKGDYYNYEEQTYSWLIQKLASMSESTYKGCPVNIPETVLFQNGKPFKAIKTTREDGLVNQVKGSIGSLLDLRKYLLSLSNERNKEYQRKLQQIKFEQAALLKKKALEKAQQKLLAATRGKTVAAAIESTVGKSHKSRMQSNLSQASLDSKESQANVIGPPSETQHEMKQKRDAFMIRFKKGSDNFDKVLLETSLNKELQDKRESDKYIQDLSSISLTPIAKSGLGKLFTFEFIAPCFETSKPKSRKQEIKYKSMSFYGKVHYNFQQFDSDDEVLKKKAPIQYCIKMCHIMGFYLQRVHGFEILQMKVDFNQDEFGEIWLMQVNNLFVRKARHVPTDKGSQVADYVLKRIQDLEREEAKKKIAKEKALAKLMREQQEDSSPSPTREHRFSVMKRARSIADQSRLSFGNSRQNNSLRKNTMSPTGQNQQNLPQQKSVNIQEPKEIFKRIHPHFFISEMSMANADESWLQEMDQSVQMQHNYYPRTNFNSKISAPPLAEKSQDPLQVSRSSYLNDSDNVHRINQLKELRLSLNKLRDQNSTTNASTDAQHQEQLIQSRMEQLQQKSFERPAGKQKLVLQPQKNNASSSYIAFFENRMANSTSNVDYEAKTFKYLNEQQQSVVTGPMRSKQKSLREVEKLLQENCLLKRDCSQFDETTQRKAVNSLRTQCPLIKQETVIKNVKISAKRYQEYKKQHMFQVNSMNGDSTLAGSHYTKSAQSKQTKTPQKFTYNKVRGAASNKLRNGKGLRSQQHSKNSHSLREVVDLDSDLPTKAFNPFASGEALEQFEIKVAQRNQEKLDEMGASSISKKFRSIDMENPYLRDFTRMHAKSQRMKEVLNDQQINLQMRCDFLELQGELEQPESSIETVTSLEQKPQKEHPMLKYRQMTTEFEARQEEKSQRLAHNYEQAISQPLISLTDQNAEAAAKIHLMSQSHQQESIISQAQVVEADDRNKKQQMDIESVQKADSIFIDVTKDEVKQQDSSKISQSAVVLGKNESAVVMAEVVTCLGAENCQGMPHQKARNYARFIMNSKENQMNNGPKQTGQKMKGEGRQSVLNPITTFMIGSSSLVDETTRLAYSREGQTEVSQRKDDKSIIMGGRSTSQNPVHTSYNAWPYAGDRGSSQNRRSRDSKPMTNQKARALVQQDYFLQRQGNSHKLLLNKKDDASNLVATVLSADQNNPTFSYETFLNQPTSIKQNMKLGMAKHSFIGGTRGAPSPFGVANLVKGSIPSRKHRNTSTLISQTSEIGGTTHYGTFAAMSTGKVQNKVGRDTSQSAMQSINSEQYPSGLQTGINSNSNSNSHVLKFGQKQKVIVNQGYLQNIQNETQFTAAINPHAHSFLNQQSSSHSSTSIRKNGQPLHLKNRANVGRYSGLGQYTTKNTSPFFQNK